MEFNKKEEPKELLPKNIDYLVNSTPLTKSSFSNEHHSEKELEHVDGASPENIHVKQLFSKRKREKNPEQYKILECPSHLIAWHYDD